MIHWLVQSLYDHPALAQGQAPPGLLSSTERARLASLRVDKRRRDWVLGRWTAKHLLQAALQREAQLRLPFTAFSIEYDAKGAPQVVFDAAWERRDAPEPVATNAGEHRVRPYVPAQPAVPSNGHASPPIPSLSLSISHSDGHAFCAVSLLPGCHVGADIECIVPRSAGFVSDYFTPDEIAHVDAAPAQLRDVLVNATWSGKEAALKALRLGLSVDTRRVVCLVEVPADASDPVLFGYRWAQLEVRVEPEVLDAAGSSRAAHLSGWWQVMSNYVLTLVLLT
jgi:4'-phosphopantetheinyl transferase